MLGAPQTDMDEIEWTDRIEEATQGIPEYSAGKSAGKTMIREVLYGLAPDLSVVITMASKQGGGFWIKL